MSHEAIQDIRARQLAQATNADMEGQLAKSLEQIRKGYQPGKIIITNPALGLFVCVDDNYEPGMPQGTGETSDEALLEYCASLMAWLERRAR